MSEEQTRKRRFIPSDDDASVDVKKIVNRDFAERENGDSKINETRRAFPLESHGSFHCEIYVTELLEGPGFASDHKIISNVPWQIFLAFSGSGDDRYVDFYIGCNEKSESSAWECTFTQEIRIRSSNGPDKDCHKRCPSRVVQFKNSRRTCHLIKEAELMDPAKGFVVDEKFVLEVDIKIESMKGVIRPVNYNFSEPHPLGDAILRLEDGVLYASRALLSLHSSFFYNIFNTFKENEKAEVDLKGVVMDEMDELLRVIYPEEKKVMVEKENVEYLLDIAHRFDILAVIYICQEYLKTTDEMSLPRKLMLSDKYKLSEVQHACLQSIQYVRQIRELRNTKEYLLFSDNIKVALLEKTMQVAEDR